MHQTYPKDTIVGICCHVPFHNNLPTIQLIVSTSQLNPNLTKKQARKYYVFGETLRQIEET